LDEYFLGASRMEVVHARTIIPTRRGPSALPERLRFPQVAQIA
jgi:hypothetical protein